MTFQELYVLNRALDGQNIYGIADFSEVNIPDISIDIYKENMIKRGILKDKENFTVQGARILSYIKYYKLCDKYIMLNNLIVGKRTNGSMIALIYNPLIKDYKILPISSNVNVENIVKSYKFLEGISVNEEFFVEKIDSKELTIKYGYKKNNSLYLKIFDNVKENSYIIFLYSNIIYIYDEEEYVLKRIGKKQIIGILKKVF